MAEFSGVNSGVKKGKKDLGLLLLPPGAKVIGFFTSNRIRSEVVERTIQIIRRGRVRAIFVVSGNAMCRYPGVENDAEKIASLIAQEIKTKKGENITKDEVISLATGHIGEKLQLDKVIKAIPSLVGKLSPKYDDFSEAIMTTDTKPKVVTFQQGKLEIIGIAKGAGMIFPNFSEATTLSFIISNTKIPKRKSEIRDILSKTLGAINIDSSTSTNDSSILVFEGKVKERENIIIEGLEYVLSNLAIKIAEDGEGVEHVVKVEVSGAENQRSARKICEAISSSLLFKCSIAGASPNFGRILAAIGASGENVGTINVFLSDQFEFGKTDLNKKEEKEKIQVIKDTKVIEFDKRKAKKIMSQKYYTIKVDVGVKSEKSREVEGEGKAHILMTDLTEKYVRLNME